MEELCFQPVSPGAAGEQRGGRLLCALQQRSQWANRQRHAACLIFWEVFQKIWCACSACATIHVVLIFGVVSG